MVTVYLQKRFCEPHEIQGNEVETLMLKKIKDRSNIPCSIKRRNGFTKAGLFPRKLEVRNNKTTGGYSLEHSAAHCYRYELHQRLRKNGQKVDTIVKVLSAMSENEIRQEVIDWGHAAENRGFLASSNRHKQLVFDGLKRLGREDGRVLQSEQIRLAVTPWLQFSR